MKFQEIYEQFSMVSENDKDAMSNPLVRVFTTVIIELSRAGVNLEEQMQKLKAANDDLRNQLRDALERC